MKDQLSKQLSLGEGKTPLVRMYNLEKKLQWRGQLWAKCEYQNPTGSFKDRGSVAEISEALRLKKKSIVCASTGNMAASLAAYAARMNLRCYVVVPSSTPSEKLVQASICNAIRIVVEGNYDECVLRAEQIAREKDALLCGDYKTRRKGQRTIGVELALSNMQFNGFVCPVGNGTLGCAVSEGFEIKNQNPQFIGVQGQGADAIFQSWMYDKKIEPILKPSSLASAMNVGNPLDGYLTLEMISKTNGLLFSVSDQEILESQNLLAQMEGIFVETAAAATVAVLPNLKNTSQKLVLILTGSGLKESRKEVSIMSDERDRGIGFGEYGDTASTWQAGQATAEFNDRMEKMEKIELENKELKAVPKIAPVAIDRLPSEFQQ